MVFTVIQRVGHYGEHKRNRSPMLTKDQCCFSWFQHFLEGCQKRMGQEWRPNKAISVVELMIELLSVVEQRVTDNSTTNKNKINWLLAEGYFCVCYVMSLTSTEGLLCNLEELNKHIDEERGYVHDHSPGAWTSEG